MKIKFILASFVTFLVVLVSLVPRACENNNEVDLYGIIECDTLNITWESDIKDILAANCVVCHGPVTARNNVRHDSYEAEMIVVNDGRLRGVVNHLDGYPRMPYNMPKLPECELNKINAWLNAGAPEK